MSLNEEPQYIRQAIAGDHAAFDKLYRAHYAQIFATLARRTGDRDVADDLAQTTFLRAFRSLKAFRGDAAFSTWLTQIALNVHRSHLRAQRVRHRWIHGMEDPEIAVDIDYDLIRSENPERIVQQKQHRELVRQGIRALPARYRRAVWLRYVQEWSYEEITQALQVPMGTVKTWLNRSRRQLKGEFRKLGLQTI
ncbi:MAG: sigma-70 family RNA polymerase sigma factor [bacterium]|nr:sigma-70 family RNA polymerase sigma factor [bacterium]